METQSSSVRGRAMNAVALAFRALQNEIHLLVNLFPRLRDAFDPDELPVSFILKRDSPRFEAGRGRRDQPMAATKRLHPRACMQWPEHRGTQKKQGSDE
jgi:hypothetical protein